MQETSQTGDDSIFAYGGGIMETAELSKLCIKPWLGCIYDDLLVYSLEVAPNIYMMTSAAHEGPLSHLHYALLL